MKPSTITTQREYNRAMFEHYKPLLQSILAGLIGAVFGVVFAYCF